MSEPFDPSVQLSYDFGEAQDEGIGRDSGQTELRMVGVDFQIGEQKRFTAGLMTAAIRLDSYEYRVDLRQCFRVITL
jgi:hypothetical protein